MKFQEISQFIVIAFYKDERPGIINHNLNAMITVGGQFCQSYFSAMNRKPLLGRKAFRQA